MSTTSMAAQIPRRQGLALFILVLMLASVVSADDSPTSDNKPPSNANILLGILVFIGASVVAVLGLGYGCFVLSGTAGGGILGSWLSRVPGYTELPGSVEEGEMPSTSRTY